MSANGRRRADGCWPFRRRRSPGSTERSPTHLRPSSSEQCRVGPSVLTFTDAGVVPVPTPAQLAEIAASASVAHAKVVGEEPRVVFLSYSTKGSAEGASVTLARDAAGRFPELLPDVPADGELQGDAALVPSVGDRKALGSTVAGRANVLVFPDLASANIAYKLVQPLGGAHRSVRSSKASPSPSTISLAARRRATSPRSPASPP